MTSDCTVDLLQVMCLPVCVTGEEIPTKLLLLLVIVVAVSLCLATQICLIKSSII